MSRLQLGVYHIYICMVYIYATVVIIIGARRVIAQGISIDSMRAVTLMVVYRSAANRLALTLTRWTIINLFTNNVQFIRVGLHGLHIIKLVATSSDIRRGCANRPVERRCTCALFGPHQFLQLPTRRLLPNFEFVKTCCCCDWGPEPVRMTLNLRSNNRSQKTVNTGYSNDEPTTCA